MDRRFEELGGGIDGRFEELEQRMDERFQKVDRRLDEQASEIREIRFQLENAASITRNGRLRRMHQPINLIKVLKPSSDRHKLVWDSHPQVPKHMKNAYSLGQRAKGEFDSRWDGTSNEKSMYSFICMEAFHCSLFNTIVVHCRDWLRWS